MNCRKSILTVFWCKHTLTYYSLSGNSTVSSTLCCLTDHGIQKSVKTIWYNSSCYMHSPSGTWNWLVLRWHLTETTKSQFQSSWSNLDESHSFDIWSQDWIWCLQTYLKGYKFSWESMLLYTMSQKKLKQFSRRLLYIFKIPINSIVSMTSDIRL